MTSFFGMLTSWFYPPQGPIKATICAKGQLLCFTVGNKVLALWYLHRANWHSHWAPEPCETVCNYRKLFVSFTAWAYCCHRLILIVPMIHHWETKSIHKVCEFRSIAWTIKPSQILWCWQTLPFHPLSESAWHSWHPLCEAWVRVKVSQSWSSSSAMDMNWVPGFPEWTVKIVTTEGNEST